MAKIARFVYLAFAWLFVAGVLTQVFLAGMVVVALRLSWDPHIGLGHSLALPLLLMLVSMYLGRMPRPVKTLTWVLFGVYVLQSDVLIFMRLQAPVLAALHPVLALVDFALGLSLARRALPLARQVQARSGVQSASEISASR
jgi:hypothetical protein